MSDQVHVQPVLTSSSTNVGGFTGSCAALELEPAGRENGRPKKFFNVHSDRCLCRNSLKKTLAILTRTQGKSQEFNFTERFVVSLVYLQTLSSKQ